MQTMPNATQDQAPAPIPAPTNGAAPAQAADSAVPVQYLDPETSKRLAAIQGLGQQIKRKERERDKQETVVSARKSELEDEREKLSTINRTLTELHDELATLASGKQSERLPFAERKAEDKTAAAEDWRGVPLNTLIRPNGKLISDGKLKALAEHGTGINTIGDLVDHQAKYGDFWAKEIKGLGKGGADQVAGALEMYWTQHPREEEKAEPDAVPVDQAMGKPKTRKGKGRKGR